VDADRRIYLTRIQADWDANNHEWQNQELSFFYAKGIITSPSGNMMTAYFAKSKSGRKFPYYEDKTCKGSIINADRTHQVILSIIQEINLEIPLSKIAIARDIATMFRMTQERYEVCAGKIQTDHCF
jgi:hypothetical protein